MLSAHTENLINVLGEGLATDYAKDRLRKGCLLLISKAKDDSLPEAIFYKMTIPIYTRAVHQGHGFEIDEESYINSLINFTHTKILFLAKPEIKNYESVPVDEAAETMEMFAQEFMNTLDSQG